MRSRATGDDDRVTPVHTTTLDGVALCGLLVRAAATPTDPAVVFGHGFTNNITKPLVNRLIMHCALHADVIAFDFRGHGRSGGGSLVGGIEELDIDAAVRFARSAGYRRVVTMGFS
ncbi:MAG: alpha/beta hydrolase, partial [Sciscionella sp.]